MKAIILLLSLISCSWGFPASKKSTVPQLDGKIIGGYNVTIADHPYQISLLYTNSHICGGSIISKSWILTAAHCVDRGIASMFAVRAGSTFHKTGGVVVDVSDIKRHDQYNSKSQDYDLALLYLSSPLKFQTGIDSISLVDIVPAAGTKAIVTGWGEAAGGKSLTSVLKATMVPIVSNSQCAQSYKQYKITPRMLCAGYDDGGHDSCQGDSGGPLATSSGLVGVVSWGYGCALPNYPGVYANVPNLKPWIQSIAEVYA